MTRRVWCHVGILAGLRRSMGSSRFVHVGRIMEIKGDKARLAGMREFAPIRRMMPCPSESFDCLELLPEARK